MFLGKISVHMGDRKMLLLLVTKDKLLTETITGILAENQDMHLVLADNIRQALEITSKKPVSIVVLDGRNGSEGEIRELKNKNILVIVDEGSMARLPELIAIGAKDYIIDPFKKIDFLSRIKVFQQRAKVARRLEEELAKACVIHERALPKEFPVMRGTEIAAFYQPAQCLGGDYYNVLKVDNGILSNTFDQYIIYLTDVSGHGLDSAMLNNFVIDAINNYFILKHEPGEVISPKHIMDYLVKLYHRENFPEDYFVCIFLGVIDLTVNEVVFCSVGFQTPPVIACRDGGVEELPGGGLPISNAVEPSLMDYQEHSLQLFPELTLLISTDGLLDQESQGQYYLERAKRVLAANAQLKPSEIVAKMAKDFKEFLGIWPNNDDISFIVLQYKEQMRRL